jgi:hypothetical protein
VRCNTHFPLQMKYVDLSRNGKSNKTLSFQLALSHITPALIRPATVIRSIQEDA